MLIGAGLELTCVGFIAKLRGSRRSRGAAKDTPAGSNRFRPYPRVIVHEPRVASWRV